MEEILFVERRGENEEAKHDVSRNIVHVACENNDSDVNKWKVRGRAHPRRARINLTWRVIVTFFVIRVCERACESCGKYKHTRAQIQ